MVQYLFERSWLECVQEKKASVASQMPNCVIEFIHREVREVRVDQASRAVGDSLAYFLSETKMSLSWKSHLQSLFQRAFPPLPPIRLGEAIKPITAETDGCKSVEVSEFCRKQLPKVQKEKEVRSKYVFCQASCSKHVHGSFFHLVKAAITETKPSGRRDVSGSCPWRLPVYAAMGACCLGVVGGWGWQQLGMASESDKTCRSSDKYP